MRRQTLRDVLQELDLTELLTMFEKEMMDTEALVIPLSCLAYSDVLHW